ncbi:MAG: hypothetical protein JXQ75_06425 [Phycisphaerae bacterium]|nr:hypothetical protein [Phycisphaerae bacterium]
MGATLDALHRLQEVELHIAEVRQRIDRKHRAVKKQEKRIADLITRIRKKEAALRADQMEADRLDLDMKAHEVEIAKLRQALNVAKTNKEYSAILTQLNTTKADNSKVEERVLALFNQLEAKRKDLESIREEYGKEGARLDELKEAARAVEEDSRDRLAQLDLERDDAGAAVPPTALNTFNRVAKKNNGEAMALLCRTNPKREEYACEGCNMSVTLEQVNAILSRDEAVLCNTCGRILYLESPTPSRAR